MPLRYRPRPKKWQFDLTELFEPEPFCIIQKDIEVFFRRIVLVIDFCESVGVFGPEFKDIYKEQYHHVKRECINRKFQLHENGVQTDGEHCHQRYQDNHPQVGPKRGYQEKSSQGNGGKDVIEADIAVIDLRDIGTDQVIEQVRYEKSKQ